MVANPMPRLNRQAGVTLISLMIGMVISLLGISASLVLYKSLIKVATETQLDSIYDGQMASALLTAQLEMQTAGFGIIPGTAPQIVTNTQSGTVSIYWRYHDGTKYICRGFRDTALTSSSREFQIIETSDAACTASAALASLSWTKRNALGAFQKISDPIISPTLSTQNCWPYGVGKLASHSMIKIQAKTASQNALMAAATTAADKAAVPSNTYSFCLPNT